MVVLSHGHYDHSGGILTFTEKNRHARIYMQQKATGDFYHGERYIGIDRRIPDLPQVEMIRGDRVLDGEVSLFPTLQGDGVFPKAIWFLPGKSMEKSSRIPLIMNSAWS